MSIRDEKKEKTNEKAEVDKVPHVCPLCGSTTIPYHFGYRPRIYLDLPIRMRPVRLIARRRRYRCKDCDATFLDQLSGISQTHEVTERLVRYI